MGKDIDKCTERGNVNMYILKSHNNGNVLTNAKHIQKCFQLDIKKSSSECKVIQNIFHIKAEIVNVMSSS